MEKYSAYRDPGTGIQPFLTPVPPVGSDGLASALLPLGYLFGLLRTILVLALALLHVVLVQGVSLIFTPIPPLHRAVTHLFTAVLVRLVLLLAGLWWIPVEQVTRKRTKGPKIHERWNPRAGDLIISNWVSWIEVLYLAFRFNPIFVLPVPSALPAAAASSLPSTPVTHTPGRRTGTGSAAISSPGARKPIAKVPITRFRRVSLYAMLRATGAVPPYSTLGGRGLDGALTLEEVRRSADRPVVLFPECTTSNGRGLLRFADVLAGDKAPTKSSRIFLMCVRYDLPTALSPTLSHSIPSRLNPLGHLFSLTTSLAPLTLSIRLLAPSDSPSSPAFSVSDVVSVDSIESGADPLSEACAALIAQTGKMKRVGFGWEDKAAFLDFYSSKRK